MGAILSILKLEIKSYFTNTSALFWTFIYPILMLLLLVFIFSKNTTEIFYFNSIIGLMGLLIISSAIFGLTQAIASSRSHNVFLFYALSPATFKQITLALHCFKINRCNHIRFCLYLHFFLCIQHHCSPEF